MGHVSWTIGDILKVTTDYLEKKKIDSPRLSAEILLAHQLNIDRVKLYLNFDQPLQDEEIAGYRALVRRRLRREPIQYITEVQEFWSLVFMVGPRVLIPRAETEVLVEQALFLHKEGAVPRRPRILDLGTGCGVIAICLAKEVTGASIWATDISEEALRLARSNARKHAVSEKITFLLGDTWEPVAALNLTFDLILSNPPYIASEELSSLPPEVRDHEPVVAFDGGEGGMFFIEKILLEGADYLSPGGWILLEMDSRQTDAALRLIDGSDRYHYRERFMDYSHRYRVVVAQRK
jgi:release factor glutamine methyltransferase